MAIVLGLLGLNEVAISWEAFLVELESKHKDYEAPILLRDRAEEFARRVLGFLFPHFQESGHEQHSVRDEFGHIAEILDEVVKPLVNRSSCLDIRKTFEGKLPEIRRLLLTDAEATFQNDPAAESLDEVILAYPGFFAIAIHRIAHCFYECGVPFFPRLLAEYAHRHTGVDIHPGAQIGESFSIDHGTGIVIGETAVIGDRVRIFQGVTLGALSVAKSKAGTKRHPTIEDDVVIYASATILGGKTTVGRGSTIGGNVWLTNSVSPNAVITSNSQQRAGSIEDDYLEYHI